MEGDEKSGKNGKRATLDTFLVTGAFCACGGVAGEGRREVTVYVKALARERILINSNYAGGVFVSSFGVSLGEVFPLL